MKYFKSEIPAVKYYRIVRLFALARGLRFWTTEDQKKAIVQYEKKAAKWN